MLTCSILDSTEWTKTLSKEWEELFLNSFSVTPFQSFEWVSTWWNWFGGSKKPHIFEVREGKDLIGLMPMYETSFPVRILRPVGKGHSDYLQPLIRKGYEHSFCERFSDYLHTLKKIDLIDLQQIRENHPLLNYFSSCQIIHQDACYLLDLPSHFEDYLKGLSKSMRYEARRINRPPFTTRQAQIRTVVDPEEIEKAFHIFFQLHVKRWRQRALPGSFARPMTQKFHMDYAKKACAKGELKFSILEYDGKPVGALYVMKAGCSYFFYQSGFDPHFKTLSPGNVLVSHTIQLAISEGATQFDFMRGLEPYKSRWKPQKAMKNFRILKHSDHLKGKVSAFLGASATKSRFKNTLKSVQLSPS